MESQKKMMVVFGLLAAVFLESVAAQTVHVVGGSVGWTIPQNGAQEYVTWASSQKFIVGDVLIFNFTTDAHDVVQVPKASFDSCSSANPIGSTITTGPANITLTSAGGHYYICTFGRHCQSGQKLAITVSESTSPGASPSAPTPTSPPPPTTTTTPTTPSPTSDAPCPPVQAPTPSTKTAGPTASSTPGSTVLPPSSSSPAVGASFVLCLFSLVMGLFF